VNAISTVQVRVEGGGDQVVAHVGLHALGRFGDRLGLSDELAAAVAAGGESRLLGHDRGKVVAQVMLMLAGGGECCADIEWLRSQPGLFESVPSDSTVHRTFTAIDDATLGWLWQAVRDVRAQVWSRTAATTGGGEVVLDIDASLVEIHSENKEGTAPSYKGGFGFHPMFCFADATGETLAGLLRPGNAGANNIADHLAVLDAAIGQLPAEIAAGHGDGDNPVSVARPVRVRADSAGCSAKFAAACRARNVGFSVVARSTRQIGAAISALIDDEDRWAPAADQDGSVRDRSSVVEVTGLVDLAAWPAGTRLIVRREPLHPGAQTSLFPSLEHRYWGHYTDAAGDAATLDAHMRAHAHVEDHIRRLKASGLERFPFASLAANRAWMATVGFAADLVRWFQLLCLHGALVTAEPKTLRWALWHTPARIVRRARQHVVRIIDGWPTARQLLDAYSNIELIT
jgi:hypothetical protein